jgi:FlaA1/EpsC-like NDP-sugar epimerase
VTGAGGSIGCELALQISKLGTAKLLLLDKDENGLNDTCLRLEHGFLAKATPVVGDLRFAEHLRSILETFRPEVVFHAAAHKHVHLMDANPCEAITNNVTGTRDLIERCLADWRCPVRASLDRESRESEFHHGRVQAGV